MSVIYRELPEIDLELATQAGEWHEFSQHGCWKKLCIHMEELVSEAKTDLDGCLSGDPMTHMRLNLRHQQRNAMMLSIKGLVENWNKERQTIIEEIANGNDSNSTERND